MGRRTKGEGGVYRRADGRWCASVDLGIVRDKRRRRVVYGKTRREVAQKLFALRKEAERGNLREPNRLTVEHFLDRWLEDGARPSVRQTTLENYRSVIRNHIVPGLGSERLSGLSPLKIQEFYSTMQKTGVSPRMRQLVHAVLHRALGQAVRWNVISQNPAANVVRPKVPRHEVNALSPAQSRRLLEVAKGGPYEALYVLALTTGLRQGELFGLRWKDVNLRQRSISVQRAIVEVNGRIQVSEPKSAKGRRRVELSKLALDAIRAHRKQLRATPHPEAWVFSDSKGGPIRKNNFTRRFWWPLRERAGLAGVRFHDLRHTAASLLLSTGVHPKVVQERLGHSSVVLTLDVYSHVLGSLQRDAADRIDEILG